MKRTATSTPIQASESTIEQGATPIAIDWEFNNSQYAADLKAKGVDLTVAVPDRRPLLGLLRPGDQQVRPAPGRRPAVGGVPLRRAGPERLHGGFARPAEFDAMQPASTLDAADLANLPKVNGTPQFPTPAQLTAAQNLVTAKWAAALG